MACVTHLFQPCRPELQAWLSMFASIGKAAADARIVLAIVWRGPRREVIAVGW